MNRLLRTARDLQSFCDSHGWRSCCIGGVAVQRWGEPGVTRNVDITLLTGFGREPEFIDVLLGAFPARVENPREFALRRRVLLLKTPQGIGLDTRATPFPFGPGLEIRTCSAEDLIVRDAEGVVVRHRENLDWSYIEEQLTPLAEAKEEPEILQTLNRLRQATF